MNKIEKKNGRKRIYLGMFATALILGSTSVYSRYDTVELNQPEPVAQVVPHEEVVEPIIEQVTVEQPTVEEPVIVQAVPIQEPAPVAETVVSNDQLAWNYFINKGYSRIAVAGIMGNLRQEHNYQTGDTPNGLGIAQWTQGRRLLLMTRPNYEDINVQLDYLNYELNTGYSMVRDGLHTATTIEQATIVFQNEFERCGDCRESQRIQYAYEAYSRY